MAQPPILESRYVRIWRGTPGGGGTPEPYFVCGLTTKNLSQTKTTQSVQVPDCDDPSIVPPMKRTIQSKDVTMSGSGFYEPARRDDLQDAFDDDSSLNWSFEILQEHVSGTSVNDGWYIGRFFITQLNFNAEDGDYARVDMAWESDGPVTWVAAS